MKLIGTVAELTNRVNAIEFVLHTAEGQDTRIQIASELAQTIKNGDHVEVIGELPPDPPFIATSIVKTTPKKATSFPLKWMLIGVAACLLIVVAIVLLTGSKDAWTVMVADVSGSPVANVSVQLTDSTNTAIKQQTADANGKATFQQLKAGTYNAIGPGGASVSIQFDGKTSQTSTLKVHSPFVWTVKTAVCGIPLSGESVTLSGPTLGSGSTNSAGEYAFTNLAIGTYTAKDGDLTVSAVINGITAPAEGVLNLRRRPCVRFPFGGSSLSQRPINEHRLQ